MKIGQEKFDLTKLDSLIVSCINEERIEGCLITYYIARY